MITDLHLQKYLDGRLSESETQAVAEMLAKSPELRERLAALENQSQIVGRPRWARLLLDRKDLARRKSKWTYLPIVILILFIFSLAGHWFSRPGDNSTFTYQAGNASSIELLYDGDNRWRYLDLRYQLNDSLTFSIRDEGRYFVGVYALYGSEGDGDVKMLRVFTSDQAYSRSETIPTFLLPPPMGSNTSTAPDHFLIAYHREFLPEISPEILATLWTSDAAPPFKFQLFSLSPTR